MPAADKKPKKITNRPLTRKQAAFVKHLVENPKQSATAAAAATYNLKNRKVAGVVANENLKKPSIVSELAKYTNLVENTLVTTVSDWGRSDNSRQREIAQNAAMYVHDKIHGKATQKTEVLSTTLNIGIDLSGLNAANDPTYSVGDANT
jgi:hypothetical protein